MEMEVNNVIDTDPIDGAEMAYLTSACMQDELPCAAPDRPVLDVCCGSRMMWFDKADGRALFLDKRSEVTRDPRGAEIVVQPDLLADFRSLPFEDNTFSLVVFDPPHTFNGKNSAMAKKYGSLGPGWRDEITRGFSECFRVLKPNGTLIFKWNEHRVPVNTVLSMTTEKPLFGHRSGSTARTHWLVFMKRQCSNTATHG